MPDLTMTAAAADKRATFRRMHDSGFFILPNAWDAGSAVRLTDAGFKAIASTSSRTQPARARSRTRAPSTSCSAS
ncbi:hypothetical protein Mnod_6843 [Methylobacterium nodulans ORS 2060]|uniref:2-methylisocitrate lyase n=1 Tax=Methylobacterium nodulans (strain LMG 21967 / CNCM I-2342 / ORS 2060) TaxID=460265 RepID=B8IGB8_METNO|nr:hypothetical protein Mnod_6843 [Methylobacterium nodulans ORS 2060]